MRCILFIFTEFARFAQKRGLVNYPSFIPIKNLLENSYTRIFFQSHSCYGTESSKWTGVDLCNSELQLYMKSVYGNYVLKKDKQDKDFVSTNEENFQLENIQPLVHSIKEIWDLEEEKKQLLEMVPAEEGSSNNKEMIQLVNEEVENMNVKFEDLKAKMLDLMVPREARDDQDVIVEVSTGVGGQEAMLFTKELFDMYCNYANFKGWTVQIVEYMESELGGLRRASMSISGDGVGEYMKFESGVHRVQRVPRTEKSGRIHTSTTTVAVLPKPTEIEVTLNPKDLVVDTKCASGPGGQHVNKTESAVRITHLPSGIVVECQQGRSQLQNKEIAMSMLRTKLYNQQQEEQTNLEYTARKSQVGSAGRSEKIRTYNYSQDRISDHRLHTTYHNLPGFLGGDNQLDSMINEVAHTQRLQRLQDLLANKEL